VITDQTGAHPIFQDAADIEDRVTQQIEQYYRPQAARQDQLLRRARRAEIMARRARRKRPPPWRELSTLSRGPYGYRC
jgi:hypothetical protein